jgi:hypothetical protein
MSSCMDFLGNQYLMDQYKKSATPEDGGNVLAALVLNLEADGMTIPEAYKEVSGLVQNDDNAEVALAIVRKTHRLEIV